MRALLVAFAVVSLAAGVAFLLGLEQVVSQYAFFAIGFGYFRFVRTPSDRIPDRPERKGCTRLR